MLWYNNELEVRTMTSNFTCVYFNRYQIRIWILTMTMTMNTTMNMNMNKGLWLRMLYYVLTLSHMDSSFECSIAFQKIAKEYDNVAFARIDTEGNDVSTLKIFCWFLSLFHSFVRLVHSWWNFPLCISIPILIFLRSTFKLNRNSRIKKEFNCSQHSVFTKRDKK